VLPLHPEGPTKKAALKHKPAASSTPRRKRHPEGSADRAGTSPCPGTEEFVASGSESFPVGPVFGCMSRAAYLQSGKVTVFRYLFYRRLPVTSTRLHWVANEHSSPRQRRRAGSCSVQHGPAGASSHGSGARPASGKASVRTRSDARLIRKDRQYKHRLKPCQVRKNRGAGSRLPHGEGTSNHHRSEVVL